MITRARAFSTQALKIVNNAAKQQFVVTLQSAEATVSYDKKGGEITFIHTNVPKEFQGRGVGKLLAQHVFTYANDNTLKVVCKCHFLAKYYEDNLDKFKNLQVQLDLE